jgi:hypothetical protein
VDVVEADLEAPEPRLLEQPDSGIEGRQLGLISAISCSTRSISSGVASDTR